MAVAATLVAVVVALLKEDIRRLWDAPVLTIEPKSKDVVTEVTEPSQAPAGAKGTLRATRYEVPLVARNDGKQIAKECKLVLESLHYQRLGADELEQIDILSPAVTWTIPKAPSVEIVRTGRVTVCAATVSEPQGDAAGTEQAKPQLRIGAEEIDRVEGSGTWIAIFMLHAENHAPFRYELRIGWDGVWESRLTEFRSHFKVTTRIAREL
jgi:hypothetical protein